MAANFINFTSPYRFATLDMKAVIKWHDYFICQYPFQIIYYYIVNISKEIK